MKKILQHDQRDCGPTCLAMIARHYGIYLSLSKFREITKTDKEGCSIYSIVDAAKTLGFSSDALSGTAEELLNEIANKNIRFPFIAHTFKDNLSLHFVVVTDLKNDRFYINDPACGKITLKKELFFNIWTGHIVTFSPTPRLQKSKKVHRNFLFRLLINQQPKLFSIFLASVAISFISITGTYTFKFLIDSASNNVVFPFSDQAGIIYAVYAFAHRISNSLDTISFIFIALILLYLLMALIQYWRGKLIITLANSIDKKLTLSYFFHLLDLPPRSIAIRQTGEYLSRFSDISTIRTAISTATVTLLLDTFMAIGSGFILFTENSRLFFISLTIIGLYTLIVFLFKKPIEISNRNVMEKNSILQSFFKESIDGIETIKTSCGVEKTKKSAKEKLLSFLSTIYHSNIVGTIQNTIVITVELIGTAIILWVGFEMVAKKQISIGQIVTFYALLAYFTEPIKNLIGLQSTLQTAFVAMDRLYDILDLETENTSKGTETIGRFDYISFKNIDFRYGNRELTLKHISFSFKRGDKIAIVGESGSGKTTLAKLLLRFFDPESGEIVINGKNISNYNLAALRSEIAYVEPAPFLFSDTILNNLKLVNENLSDKQIMDVCKHCCIHDFIMSLPLGYNTPLEENGINLSGGQRQRIAIARAILKNPQLLILDEATSNLDTATESEIKNMIFSYKSDLTCLIIAHRLSTIKNCDKIIVLDHGEIVEIGTHEELLNKGEKYATLWKKQQ